MPAISRGEFYSLGGLFIATKVWTSGLERGVAQIKESLRLLGIAHERANMLADFRNL